MSSLLSSTADPAKIAARAEELVGVRYLPRGRLPLGLDCLGLVLECLGLAPDTIRRYPAAVRGPEVWKLIAPFAQVLPLGEIHDGDVVLSVHRLAHLGIATRDGASVVHACIRSGSVQSVPLSIFGPTHRLELHGDR